MTSARLIRAAVVIIVLAGLALFARTVDWSEAWRAARAASPGMLIAAALVNVVSIGFKGVRWWVFLRSIGVHSLGLAIRGTMAGAAFNNIFIANTGEVGRVVLVARAAQVPSERVLATLALERLFEFVGYFLLLGIAVAFLDLPPALDRVRPYAGVGIVTLAIVLVILVRHPGSDVAATEIPQSVLARARRYVRGFLRTMAGISTVPRFAAAFVATMSVWSLQIVTYHLTAAAAHFEITVAGTIAALLAVNLGFFTRATPGNVGVFQAVYAMTAVAFGLDKDAAIGVALLIQFQQIVPITILGLLAASASGPRQPTDPEVAAQ
jgi:glycosyltransferase 2 family protein